MKVLGIDPGFAHLGYALLELSPTTGLPLVADLGVVRTSKSSKKLRVLAADDNIRRGRELAKALHEKLAPPAGAGKEALFADRVRLICAETMSFPRNASAAAKVAMTWGIIIDQLVTRDLPLLQASPQEVKRRITGVSDASKDYVQKVLVKRFGRGLLRRLRDVPEGEHEHAFDALASALACLDSQEARLLRAAVP